MKLIKIQFLFLCFIFINIPNNAFAYLDPGTGTFILQALAVIIASVIAFFTSFIYKTKLFLNKIKNFFKKKKTK